ncbi:unnamed protein product [Symbiodinium sp. CCMP2592]|nr:unnamed protein product [Symbiodinium sp. CCMP2592]
MWRRWKLHLRWGLRLGVTAVAHRLAHLARRTPSPSSVRFQSFQSKHTALAQEIQALRRSMQNRSERAGNEAISTRAALRDFDQRLSRLEARSERTEDEIHEIHEQIGRILEIVNS